ncbi:MAG TPA: sulfatase [Woeseiaceae bacterium]|jgi:arylsulfatase A-like enzyme|nr:sulfatase [Woeseiaceae bacterium]
MPLIRNIWSWLLRLSLLGVALLAVLTVVNIIRIDAFTLTDHVEDAVDRAEAVRREAFPEYQDLALARLPKNSINGDYFRFDDNIHLARAGDDRSNEADDGGSDAGGDDSSNAAGHDAREFQFHLEFEDADEVELVPVNGESSTELRDGLLVINHREDDYLVNGRPIHIPVSAISEVMIRARGNKGNRFGLLWAAEGRESEIADNHLDLDLIADGKFHTYIVDAQNALRRGVHSGESVSLIGIEPSNEDGATVEIDFVRFLSRLWKYEVLGSGTSYESIGGELRHVLHMAMNRTLEYSVDVPRRRPRLSFGTAVLMSGAPIEASLSVSDAKETRRLYRGSDLTSDKWQDHELDLSPWAGQTVKVRFDVRGGSRNVVLWSNPIVRSAPRSRFNVILILEDALRADHLSTLGHIRKTSPGKTRLASERGIVFLNAHSQATKTRPSVASLMTSLLPTATGVWNFSAMLSDRYLTLAELMRAQGYRTASFIQNGNAGPYAGAHQGFSFLRNGRSVGHTTEDLFGQRTIAWLEQNRRQNVFVYLHAIDPHGPYDPPPPYDDWYRNAPAESLVGETPLEKAEQLDPDWAKTPSAEARRLLYDGEILHNDAIIERFISELNERRLLEDTLLVFVSDHGEWLGERGRWEHHPPGNLPGIHVQMIVVYPKRFGGPRRIEESVQLIDVMPTILELAGIDDSDLLMQGDSLVSLIEGKDPERWRDRVTVSEEPMAMDRGDDPCTCGSLFYKEWQLHGSVRQRPYRVHSAFIKSNVYRLKSDGVTPVISFLPDLYSRILRAHALSRIQSANVATWRKLTEGEAHDVYRMDPAVLEELRGLGYVN